MLTPKQLHYKYSSQPCACSEHTPPYTDATKAQSYGWLSPYGDGTPFNLLRIVHFLKHVKYPCVDTSNLNSARNGLVLTYKFLTNLDKDIYAEQQPTVEAGTSYAVRNCCDLSRACKLTAAKQKSSFGARMATEYLQYLGENSLPDCLMACGPNLVSDVVAKYYRAPGIKVGKGEPYDNVNNPASQEDPNGDFLTEALNEQGMFCFPGDNLSFAGSKHFCWTPPCAPDPPTYCVSTDPCESECPGPVDEDDPCCNKGTMWSAIQCNEDALSSRALFSTPSTEYFPQMLKKVGILKRQSYDGWADFTHPTGPKLGTYPDMWLKHFQDNPPSDSARTISIILRASHNTETLITQTNEDKISMLTTVKQLLTNGYGVLLFSNIGFPNERQSDGLCYPDRIFYHTYNIIGYDASQNKYNETVYVLHSAFGNWISGGQPYWGDLPTGAFLVTETYLKHMISYDSTSDFYNCRSKICYNSPTRNCLDPSVIAEYKGCPSPGTPPPPENRSKPYWCSKRQKPFGLLFTIGLTDQLDAQSLNYDDPMALGISLNYNKIKESIIEAEDL